MAKTVIYVFYHKKRKLEKNEEANGKNFHYLFCGRAYLGKRNRLPIFHGFPYVMIHEDIIKTSTLLFTSAFVHVISTLQPCEIADYPQFVHENSETKVQELPQAMPTAESRSRTVPGLSSPP